MDGWGGYHALHDSHVHSSTIFIYLSIHPAVYPSIYRCVYPSISGIVQTALYIDFFYTHANAKRERIDAPIELPA